MTEKTIKMSVHLIKERSSRMNDLLEQVMNGEVVLEVPVKDKIECLTDTGLVIVKNLQRDFIITCYLASIEKAYAMYHSAGYSRIPNYVSKNIKKANGPKNKKKKIY